MFVRQLFKKSNVENINQSQFLELASIAEYKILDVRTPEECATGIVPGAIIINFMNTGTFEAEIKKLDKETPYLIYCRSGNRSSKAAKKMDSLGFKKTYNLIGGMLAWTGPLEVYRATST